MANTKKKSQTPSTAPSVDLPLAAPVDLNPNDSVLITKAVVLARVPFSFATLWRKMQNKEFPRARIDGNRVFWLKHEVDSWIANMKLCAYLGDTDGVRPPDPFRHERRRAEKKASKPKPCSRDAEA
jgi:predicted DNA-binding transcriptional regulator AlpA